MLGQALNSELRTTDTGPEANWFVTISGERGDDGHVSIDRIDRGLPGNRRWCFRCTACGT